MGYLSVVFNEFYKKRDVNIINEFRNRLWNTLPYQKLNRKYTYKVSKEILNNEIYEKLNAFHTIDYKILKSRYGQCELRSEDYIKARVNSNYGKYFDKEVYLSKSYYYHLANYKNIYYRYMKDNTIDVINEIDLNTTNIHNLLDEVYKRKVDLSWQDYKEYVNGVIPRIFDNYIPMDIKILSGKWNPNYNNDWDEDNYIIKYFNKSLDGYVKKYVDTIKGERVSNVKQKKCVICGKYVQAKSNRKKYCNECLKGVRAKQNRNSYKNIKDVRKCQ